MRSLSIISHNNFDYRKLFQNEQTRILLKDKGRQYNFNILNKLGTFVLYYMLKHVYC